MSLSMSMSIPVTHHHHHHLQTPSQHSNQNNPKQQQQTRRLDHTTHHTNRPATPACISWFPTVSWSGSPSPNPKRPRASRYSSKGSSDPCAADWPLPCVSLIFFHFLPTSPKTAFFSSFYCTRAPEKWTCHLLKAGLWPLGRNKGALAELKVF
ncbi:hypothetical protein HDV62DRAFT_236422 [Trichoderma sp. SZMC 28011]